MRERNLDDLRAELLDLFDGGLHGLIDLRINAFDEIFFGQADFDSFDIARERECVIGNRMGNAGRIVFVMSAQDVEKRCGIVHIFGERANLVQ